MEKRRQEAQEEKTRRNSEPSTPEREVMKRVSETKERNKELDSREVRMAVACQEFTRCRERMEKRVQEVQGGVIEEDHRHVGVSCAVNGEVMKMTHQGPKRPRRASNHGASCNSRLKSSSPTRGLSSS